MSSENEGSSLSHTSEAVSSDEPGDGVKRKDEEISISDKAGSSPDKVDTVNEKGDSGDKNDTDLKSVKEVIEKSKVQESPQTDKGDEIEEVEGEKEDVSSVDVSIPVKPPSPPPTSLSGTKGDSEGEATIAGKEKSTNDFKVFDNADVKKPLIEDKRWRYFRYAITLDNHFNMPKEDLSSYEMKYWDEFERIVEEYRPKPIERLKRREEYMKLQEEVKEACLKPITEEEGCSGDKLLFSARTNLYVLLGKLQYCIADEDKEIYNKTITRKIRVDLYSLMGDEDKIKVNMIELKDDISVKLDESPDGRILVNIQESEGEKTFKHFQSFKYNNEYEISMRKVLEDRTVNYRFRRFLRGGSSYVMRKNYKVKSKILKHVMGTGSIKSIEEEQEQEQEEQEEVEGENVESNLEKIFSEAAKKKEEEERKSSRKKFTESELEAIDYSEIRSGKYEQVWLRQLQHVPKVGIKSMYGRSVVYGKRGKFQRSNNGFRIVQTHFSRYDYMHQLCSINIGVNAVIQRKYKLAMGMFTRLLNFVKSTPENLRHERHDRILSGIMYRLAMLTAFFKCDYEAAIQMVNEAQEIEPNTRNLFIRSEFYYLIKDYTKSIEDLEEVAKYTYRDRDLDDIRYNIAISYFFAFKNQKAIENFDKISNERHIRKLYLYKGLCYFDLLMYEKAREYFERGLVTLRMFLQDYQKKKTKSPVERSIEKHWKRDYNLMAAYLVEVLVKLGRMKEAEYFTREIDPSSPTLINTLLLLKKPSEAMKVCEEYLQKKPDDNNVLEQLALSLLRMREHEKAKEAYTKLIDRKYRLGNNYYNRAVCLLRENKLDEAMKDFNTGINTHKLKVFLNRGICYIQMGKFEEGLNDIDRELEVRPLSFQAHFEKANTYYLMKKYHQSLRSFDIIVEKVLGEKKKGSPEHFQCIYAKAVIFKSMGSPRLILLQKDIDKRHEKEEKLQEKQQEEQKKEETKEKEGEDESKKDSDDDDDEQEEMKKIKKLEKEYRFGEKKCYEESIRLFTILIKENYKVELCLLNRGYCYLTIKENEKALEDSDEIIKKFGTIGGYFNRGLVLKNTKRFQEALEMFTTVKDKSPKDYETKFEMSECFYHLKRLNEARDILIEVVSSVPTHAPAHHNLGYILYLQGDNEGAVTHFEKSVHLNYHFKYLYYHYGLALYALRRFEEAAQKFKFQLDPEKGIVDDPLAMFQLGCCFLNTQKYAEAVKLYDVCIRLTPTHFLSYVNRGMCYGNINQHPLAIVDYTTALKLRPKDPFTLKRRGHVYLKLGKYQEAYLDYCEFCKFYNQQQELTIEEEKLKKIVHKVIKSGGEDNDQKKEEEKVDEDDDEKKEVKEDKEKPISEKEEDETTKEKEPEESGEGNAVSPAPKKKPNIAEGIHDIEVIFRMGICEYELGMIKKAIKTFDSILKSNPQEILCHYEKGIIYYAQHEIQNALDCYTKVLEQVPDHLDSLNNRGLCYLRLKDFESALKDFTNCARFSQNRYFKANYNKGIILRQLLRHKESILAFSAALVINPSYIQSYWERANVYMDTSQWEKALADLTKSIELSGTNIAFIQNCLYSRGLCYVKLLNYVEAIRDYEHILQLNPNHSLSIFERGYCRLMMKHHDKAAEDFTLYLKLVPNSIQGLSNRGICYYKLRKYDLSMVDFQAVLKQNPKYHAALFYMGCCFLELYEDAKAIGYFTQALSVNPNYDLSYFNRGICYESAAMFQEAFQDYEKAYQLNKKNTEALQKRNKMEQILLEQSNTSSSIPTNNNNNSQDGVNNDITGNQDMNDVGDADADAAAGSADAAADAAVASGENADADMEASMFGLNDDDDDACAAGAAGADDAAAAGGM